MLATCTALTLARMPQLNSLPFFKDIEVETVSSGFATAPGIWMPPPSIASVPSMTPVQSRSVSSALPPFFWRTPTSDMDMSLM